MASVWSSDVDEFLALVLASQLIDLHDLQQALADFEVDRTTPHAIDSICVHLKGKGMLTDWQCDKLRNGKWKGFHLDNYCLLSRLSMDETTSTYRAKEVSTGKHVAIRVTPPNLSTYDVMQLPEASLEGG